MAKCAFLTIDDLEGFHVDDHLAHEPMRRKGWQVVEVPWSQTGVDWQKFDAVVIRSTWDYQHNPNSFMRTLEEIERVTPLFNPSGICRWNMDKRYLNDLESRGVPIVPTQWYQRLNQEHVEEALKPHAEGSRIIIKPTVGANADDTFVLNKDDRDGWQRIISVFADRPCMIQPFMESVIETGEYSLFFFNGEFSHAILKTPQSGDYRVQEEHGGQIQPVEPSSHLLEAGRKAIQAVIQTLLYARVDLVESETGDFAVMELELIEPSLYLSFDPAAAERFARAFVTRMAALRQNSEVSSPNQSSSFRPS